MSSHSVSLDSESIHTVITEQHGLQLSCLFCSFQTVMTPHSKTAKSNLPPVDMELGYFLQAALQSAYLCLLQRG